MVEYFEGTKFPIEKYGDSAEIVGNEPSEKEAKGLSIALSTRVKNMP